MADITIRLKIDSKEVQATLLDADKTLQQVRKSSENVSDSFAKWGMTLMGISEAIRGLREVISIIAEPVKIAGQFEKYQAQLKVILGSTEKAKERLAELSEFAATTPFELPQVIEAANQLQTFGKYSKDMLRDLGDLASASGKPMEQVIRAFAKLMSGQKGIAIDMFRDLLITTDDWVRATGKRLGPNGELQASITEMATALPKIIAEKGFAGMMQEQSKTLEGMISNFKDAQTRLQNEIGQYFLPTVKEAMNITGDFAPTLGLIGQAFLGLIPILASSRIAFANLGTTIKTTLAALGSYFTVFIVVMEAAKAVTEFLGRSKGFEAITDLRMIEEKKKLTKEQLQKELKANEKIFLEKKKFIEASRLDLSIKKEDRDLVIYQAKYLEGNYIPLLKLLIREKNNEINVDIKSAAELKNKINKLKELHLIFFKLDEKIRSFKKVEVELDWDEILGINKIDKIRKGFGPPPEEKYDWDVLEKDLNKILEQLGLIKEEKTFTNLLEDTQELTWSTFATNEAFMVLGDSIRQSLGGAIELFDEANSLLEIFIQNLMNAITQLLIMQTIKGFFNLITGGIGGFLGGFTKLQEGGIVQRPTFSLIGEAGPEAVIPLKHFYNYSPNFQQPVYVNVNPHFEGNLRVDGTELKALIRRVERMERKYS